MTLFDVPDPDEPEAHQPERVSVRLHATNRG